jgi:hypothetical protein
MKSSRRTRAAFAATIVALCFLPAHRPRPPASIPYIPESIGSEDDAHARDAMEFLMLRDPVANAIPRDIRRREVAFARSLPLRGSTRRTDLDRATRARALTWTERGPNNVGGRTRTFAIDAANPSTLIAGGVGGGIWKSTDDGASWSLRTAPAQIHSSTCIAQDPRAGQTHVWYVGTGEIRGSTTNDTRWGSLYRGDGIFKSTDNGDTWMLLPSTSSGTPQTSDDFDWVINVATTDVLAVDEVLAATYTGVYRSTDGGGSWTIALASDSGFCDVAFTGGVRYAHTRVGGVAKIWRSTDGVSWNQIQPATFPTVANRIVIALAPSNVNVLYFFVQGANTAPAVNGHQLWKYTYVSGDGSGAGGSWENRGGNLPINLSTQTGYDMTCHVKPDNLDFIVLGGVNLYRSTNGFASSGGVTVVGGSGYSNHHADAQGGAFSRVSSSVFYSSHDGGLSKTTDVTLPSVVWSSLNNGYNVTQFYSVSIPPDAGSNVIMGGAQDNGTQLGNAPGASNWDHPVGGDGTVVEVSPMADNRLYTQTQNGPLYRLDWDTSNFTIITPSGSTNALFVNPIVLDPTQSSFLYYAAGTSSTTSMVWRNDNAPTATTTVGWNTLPTTNVGAGSGYFRRISAMGISTFNQPNVLYYGTIDGIVMKAENVHTASPTVTTVTPPTPGAGLAHGGFVRCIAVDPTDANRALVAFGNYNFPSLWYTTDGGASWTDVEGNVAGPAGPSVRWASMFYVGGQLQVFLATSVGVLSTTSLDGGATVWAQEAPTEVGNTICAYMDYRASDRTLAIATHGRGVFTTQFFPTSEVADGTPGLALLQNSPNPVRGGATTIAYQLPQAAEVSLRLYDVTGREVAVLASGRQDRGRHEVRLRTERFPRGIYYYVLKAGGGHVTRRMSMVD